MAFSRQSDHTTHPTCRLWTSASLEVLQRAHAGHEGLPLARDALVLGEELVQRAASQLFPPGVFQGLSEVFYHVELQELGRMLHKALDKEAGVNMQRCTELQHSQLLRLLLRLFHQIHELGCQLGLFFL